MHVLVFHGYLLRGTGSNIYNANLARAFLRLGHQVHLLCQDRRAAELDFVGAVGDWDTGELVIERVRDTPCTVYRPDIGGLLPVYVADRYEWMEARPFQELSESQLERYIAANVGAVEEVAALCDPDAALANHLVMGPAILARALVQRSVPYAIKIHGSALEYTVKPHPRFLTYAREGIAKASGVLVGSRHTAESLWEAIKDPELPARTRLGPPGVDVELFRPRERDAAAARVRELAERVAGLPRAAEGDRAESAFDRDHAAAARTLFELAGASASDPLVAFVGKLIVAKGIDLLLLAWPLVLAELPASRLAVVGFGAYRHAAEELLHALARSDLTAVRELALRGQAAEGGPQSRLEHVLSFLEWLEGPDQRQRYLDAGRAMPARVMFTGRLEHEELADFLPACDAMVVPSTFPESFGMVAVEAAACGVLPISAGHSGLAEVSRSLNENLPQPLRGLTSFAVGPEAVQSIAARALGWLRAPADVRERARSALVETARARYSWESVAKGVIAAARGELDDLASAA
jgi:glycosyltransferase involved in cell wall biosynthesis